MSILTDLHMHTTHSSDGKSTMEEMITASIQNGLKTICFTEHMDFDNHYALFQEAAGDYMVDTDSYWADYLLNRRVFESQIEVLFGIELGLQPGLSDVYQKYTTDYPFDFVIGSSHEAGGIDPYYKEYLNGRTPLEAWHFYFQTEIACAREITSYDIYGHLDYALRYHTNESPAFCYKEFADELDTLLTILIQSGKGIELNTGGYSYFHNEPNPHAAILKRYRELGGEIITIGSDAHQTMDVARSFEKAASLLSECGFQYYTVFRNRVPSFYHL